MSQTLMCAEGIVINQPAYLTNNWRSLINEKIHSDSRFIKVQDGVITLVTRFALLRCKVPGIVDGFYEFNDAGHLVYADFGEIRNFRQGYNNYPDVEVVRPRFEMLTHTPPILQAEVRMMVDFLNHCRAELDFRDDDNLLVFFEDDNLICHNQHSLWLKLSCQVPVNSRQGHFQANRLRHILIDMLRYEHVFMGIDLNQIPTNAYTPLVIGLDWSSCGLIKPF